MSVVQVVNKPLRVAENTILLAEADEHLAALLEIVGRSREYTVHKTQSIGDMLHALDSMQAQGEFPHFLIMGMQIGPGSMPSWFERPTAKITDTLPVIRERYGMDPLACIFTGEDAGATNPRLEQRLFANDICYLWHKGIKPKVVFDNLDELRQPYPEPIGMNIFTGGNNGVGKTNLNSRLFSLRRGKPEHITTGARHYMYGPIFLPKLSDNPHSDTANNALTDTHKDTIFIPGLSKLAPHLQRMYKRKEIVYWISREAAEYTYVYAMRTEGAQELVHLIRKHLGPQMRRRYPDLAAADVEIPKKLGITAAEDLANASIDYLTVTANPHAGHGIYEYTKAFGGKVLPVRVDVEENVLLQRWGDRERFSPVTVRHFQSDDFKYGTFKKRESIILSISQQPGEKPLHDAGKLTDLGVKWRDIYERDRQWKRFNPPEIEIFDGNNSYASVPNLERRIAHERTAELERRAREGQE